MGGGRKGGRRSSPSARELTVYMRQGKPRKTGKEDTVGTGLRRAGRGEDVEDQGGEQNGRMLKSSTAAKCRGGGARPTVKMAMQLSTIMPGVPLATK